MFEFREKQLVRKEISARIKCIMRGGAALLEVVRRNSYMCMILLFGLCARFVIHVAEVRAFRWNVTSACECAVFVVLCRLSEVPRVPMRELLLYRKSFSDFLPVVRFLRVPSSGEKTSEGA